jgi:hypothetical protein
MTAESLAPLPAIAFTSGTADAVPAETVPSEAVATEAEGGFVLVWCALMMGVLLLIAGLAVDVGHWYSQASRLQNMADSAALGGAVFLPNDPDQATATANKIVASYGTPGVNVSVDTHGRSNQLRVTVKRTVDNVFASLAGFNTTDISRTAVAEFSAPVAMGSPDHQLGNDPESPGASPQFWLGIAGPEANKMTGDRFSSLFCQGAARCQNNTNQEFNQDGYTFATDVKATAGQPLRFQIFDPSFVNVGTVCQSAKFPTPGQLDSMAARGGWWADAATRYKGGSGPWCTGDNDVNGTTVETSMVVRGPDDTNWSDLDNPIIDTPTCKPTTFPAFDLNGLGIFDLLGEKPPAPGLPADGRWSFNQVFRRWVTACEIPGDQVRTGEYIVQMRTSARASDPTHYDAGVNTGGQNFYSLRVGRAVGDNAVDGTGMTVFARGRLPIYANADAATTQFYAARVDSTTAHGRSLRITFFDVGDATMPGTLQVLPPTDANLPGGVFPGCRFTRYDGAPVQTGGSDDCKVLNVSRDTGFNGQLMYADIPIPASYTCSAGDQKGCWVRVQLSFPGGVADFSTWSAVVNGTPVRLVE